MVVGQLIRQTSVLNRKAFVLKACETRLWAFSSCLSLISYANGLVVLMVDYYFRFSGLMVNSS